LGKKVASSGGISISLGGDGDDGGDDGGGDS